MKQKQWIISTVVLLFIIGGVWRVSQMKQNNDQISPSSEESSSGESQETSAALSVSAQPLPFDSTALPPLPQGWTLNSTSTDNRYFVQSLTLPKNEAIWFTEVNVNEWLKGPTPEEGYVLPLESREPALALLQNIYNHQSITAADKADFEKMSGEFLGYSVKNRAALSYIQSKDNSYRGISFFNLQGQEVGVYPVYYVTLYNPVKNSIVFINYLPSNLYKEIKEVNKPFVTFDPNLTPEQVGKLDDKAKEGFRALLEKTPRTKLSFGAVLNQVDAFMKTVSVK